MAIENENFTLIAASNAVRTTTDNSADGAEDFIIQDKEDSQNDNMFGESFFDDIVTVNMILVLNNLPKLLTFVNMDLLPQTDMIYTT